MIKESLNKKIDKPYHYSFSLKNSGLTAISISARCSSKKQIKSNVDENLRVEINGLSCREIDHEKYKQFFNIPPAFNGSKLKGLKKTVTFLTILEKGEHVISLIPQQTATIETIKIEELFKQQEPILNIEETAEDGDRRPWHTFVLLDLPLSKFSANITIRKKFLDSDDIKIIVNGAIKRNTASIKFRFWYLAGGLLSWLFFKKEGETKKIKIEFNERLEAGIHYIEFYADKTPVLHDASFDLSYTETKAEKRAANLIKLYSRFIKKAGSEFGVDPTIIGAAIFQEQATNVNFIDNLTDYMGGILHLNTSVGVGQVRVATAGLLENYYDELKLPIRKNLFIDLTPVRVERLKDPQINIRYVAAKINFSQNRWAKAGYNISKKPEILGTLYNIEDINNPIKPHPNPKANKFGKGVKRNFKKVQKLLGL
ncbi:DUF1402 family protein [Patescibacteria group bacterium]|nr:DUF1402 family protein [Patescibacteria group bacterium]